MKMHNEKEWTRISDQKCLSARVIEVGNIFHFGTKCFSPMGEKVMGQDGKEHVVFMVSYGLDLYLVVAAIQASYYGQASRFDRFNLNRFGIKESYVIRGFYSICKQ